MKTMTIAELGNMKTDITALPKYVVATDSKGSVHVFEYSHTSLSNGYVRKNATYITRPYKGRFGEGFTVTSHNSNSSRYCYISYYVEKSHFEICTSVYPCTACPLYNADENGEHCYYNSED